MGNASGKPVVFTEEGMSSVLNWCFCGRFHASIAVSVGVTLTAMDALVNLNHFRLLRVVGKGAFGKVRIVERKDTGLTFALKYIRKDESSFPGTRCFGRAGLTDGV